jgi:hypothetical protein
METTNNFGLYITTCEPSFFGDKSKPLVKPTQLQLDIGMFGHTEIPEHCPCYIHGEAEHLAGFDIPIVLCGDLSNIVKPLEEQHIELWLPNNVKVRLRSTYSTNQSAYLFTLYEEDMVD